MKNLVSFKHTSQRQPEELANKPLSYFKLNNYGINNKKRAKKLALSHNIPQKINETNTQKNIDYSVL